MEDMLARENASLEDGFDANRAIGGGLVLNPGALDVESFLEGSVLYVGLDEGVGTRKVGAEGLETNEAKGDDLHDPEIHGVEGASNGDHVDKLV